MCASRAGYRMEVILLFIYISGHDCFVVLKYQLKFVYEICDAVFIGVDDILREAFFLFAVTYLGKKWEADHENGFILCLSQAGFSSS